MIIRNYLEELNLEQREAVQTFDGPLLVLSGAGTGKTRVLTSRIAHLLYSGLTKPWNIMAVTFTNKAAREMKERVSKIIGPSADQVIMGTFHSIGANFLRQHSELVGLKSNFSIIDVDDQVTAIKQILKDSNLDEKLYPPRLFAKIINHWKDKGLVPEKITDSEKDRFENEFAKDVYIKYQSKLKSSNSADFGDLLLYPLIILKDNIDVLEKWKSKIKYILVDEYQDTNTVQYLWLRLVSQPENNICCVGDDDQSIYGWRGAEVKNILGFEKDFPKAKVIRLEQNYRSTGNILSSANSLIDNNNFRLGKNLWTKDNKGKKILLTGVYDSSEEAKYIVNMSQTLRGEGKLLSNICVLVRTISQTREIEEQFIKGCIPYKVVGAKFFERQEIRDAIAYLRLIVNNADDLAFQRIINTPRRGIGANSIQKIIDFSLSAKCSYFLSSIEQVKLNTLSLSSKKNLERFIFQINKWGTLIYDERPSDLLQLILKDSGYIDMWKKMETIESETRIDNLNELISGMSEFENIKEFLEHVSIMTNNDRINIDGEVSLMTLHASKGLEFDYVFLPGWEDGLFPSIRSVDEKGNIGLEEERRLAYVGITRAKKELYISYSANRRIHGLWMSSIPSRFINELPKENIIENLDQGLYLPTGDSEFNDNLNNKSHFLSRHKKIYNHANYNQETFKIKTRDKQMSRNFIIGERVFHQKFGMGNVINVNGENLEISFDNAGIKKVRSDFVLKK